MRKLKITRAEYTIDIPTKIGKEHIFLSRINKAHIRYDAHEYYTLCNGLAITISSDTLQEMNVKLEEYVLLLGRHVKGILDLKSRQ